MSALFEVSIIALAANDELELEMIVCKHAIFRLVPGAKHLGGVGRSWSSACSRMEQIQAESTGLST